MSSLVDEAIKVGKEIEGFERKKEDYERQIAEAQQRFKTVTEEAEKRSREILQQAQHDASQLKKEAEGLRDLWKQRVAELEPREKAVEWVKVEDERLKALARELSNREKELEKSKSEASATKDLYTSHLNALKVQEEALAERARTTAVPSPKPSLKKS